jgi:hypothetical protein
MIHFFHSTRTSAAAETFWTMAVISPAWSVFVSYLNGSMDYAPPAMLGWLIGSAITSLFFVRWK